MNPAFTLKFIFANPHYPWTSAISGNPNIKFADVLKYPQIRLNYRLPRPPRLKKKPRKYYIINWNIAILSANPCITPEIVRNHPEIPWDNSGLNRNPSFRANDLKSLGIFNSLAYSGNPNLRAKDIFEDQNAHWMWHIVAINPGITFADYLEYPILREKLSFGICANPSVRLDDVITWLLNNGVNMHEIANGFEYGIYSHTINGLNLIEFHSNKSLTIKDTEKYPEIKWHYSDFENISVDDLKKYCEIPRYHSVSCSSKLRAQDVIENPDANWSWFNISYNKFGFDNSQKNKQLIFCIICL